MSSPLKERPSASPSIAGSPTMKFMSSERAQVHWTYLTLTLTSSRACRYVFVINQYDFCKMPIAVKVSIYMTIYLSTIKTYSLHIVPYMVFLSYVAARLECDDKILCVRKTRAYELKLRKEQYRYVIYNSTFHQQFRCLFQYLCEWLSLKLKSTEGLLLGL